MKTRITDWETNYVAMWGTVSNPQLDSWSRYIAANIQNVTPDEINKAVAALCDSWNDKIKPGIKDICHKILANRGIFNHSESESKWQLEYKDRLRKISNERDFDKIWVIICESKDCNMGARLEQWAIKNKGFARAKCPVLQESIKDLLSCFSALKAAWTNPIESEKVMGISTVKPEWMPDPYESADESEMPF